MPRGVHACHVTSTRGKGQGFRVTNTTYYPGASKPPEDDLFLILSYGLSLLLHRRVKTTRSRSLCFLHYRTEGRGYT